MAYKYDPILRMNVPVVTNDTEVAWQEFDRNDRVVTKRKEFKSIEAAEKFIEKVSEKNNFYRILATSDEKTWDNAIQSLDAPTVNYNGKVLKHYNNPNGKDLYITKISLSNGPAYLVTDTPNGTGGGSVEYSLGNAEKTAESWLLIDKLNKKYGEKEGYKRYMRGDKD